MDKNIEQTVYNSLAEATKGISNTLAAADDLEKKIKANRYSNETLTKEIRPRLESLRRKVRVDSEDAILAAKGLVSQYRADIAELDNLNPDDITDDIKLLQSGIPLLPRDIHAILKRSAGNRTMTQLVLRYADEHGIDMQGATYNGGEAERQTADNLDTAIQYYARWIDKDNAAEMLDKFFTA